MVHGHASFGSGKCPRLTIQCIKSNGHSKGFFLTDGAVLFDLAEIWGFCMSSCKTNRRQDKDDRKAAREPTNMCN